MEEVIRRGKIIWGSIKFIACITLILATFYYGYQYFNKVFINKDVNYGDSFHNMPEDTVDIIVLGSSHAQYSFIPSFAYQDTGLYSYVLGSACQPIKVSYQMLKEALKTQNPELVILEVFTATPQKETCMADSCYVTAEYQMRGEEKYNTINYLPKEKADEYKNDFLNYHNDWRTMESFDDLKIKENNEIDSFFGYLSMELPLPPENVWTVNVFNESIDVKLEEEDLGALNDINDLCKEKGIQLLLYMTPSENLDVENQSYKEEVWKWADENGVKYIDFIKLSEEEKIYIQVHSDGYHATISGAGFITDYLCNFINNNYNFESHVDNNFLNQKYSNHIDELNIMFLRNEYNADKYLSRLINSNGLIIIRYPGSSIYNEKLVNWLKQMGAGEDFDYRNGFYCIVKDGQIIDSNGIYLDTYIDDHHFEVLNYMITFDLNIIDSTSGFSIVMFNDNYSQQVVKNINIKELWEVGYDKYYQPIKY